MYLRYTQLEMPLYTPLMGERQVTNSVTQRVPSREPGSTCVLLLMSPATYRASAFLTAAETLNISALSVVDMPEELSEYWHHPHGIDFSRTDVATEHIVRIAREAHARAIVAVDDSAAELSARAGEVLGLIHNDPDAALAARDKFVMRSALSAGGVRCPRFHIVDADSDPACIAEDQTYPCVVKPLRLSGSRGVIRADNPTEFMRACERLRTILIEDGEDASSVRFLVEDYLPGDEVALEGLLTDGALTVLALFDKPDPLVGPFFEETIYVTPSRLSAEMQDAIARETEAAASALGLRHGPIHAELRINEHGPLILEVAGRSIGGLCSTVLSFGSGMSLEEIILRHAVGIDIPSFDRGGEAVGVMMIPIPRAGLLRCIDGVEEALAVENITGLEITAKINYPIVPLPEGASYLGFIFARADTPDDVERALRAAHARLRIRITPTVKISTAVLRDA